jgi:hypothetical protein
VVPPLPGEAPPAPLPPAPGPSDGELVQAEPATASKQAAANIAVRADGIDARIVPVVCILVRILVRIFVRIFISVGLAMASSCTDSAPKGRVARVPNAKGIVGGIPGSRRN